MSFGFAVGDFIAVGNLCWKVYKKCKDSSGSYVELSGEVSALYAVMKETEELLTQQDLSRKQQAHAVTCRQGCEGVLNDLEGLLAKYESLGTKSQRTFDRMGMGMQDVNGIRMRLVSNVSMLDAFNNASSHARLENKLNLLMSEVRTGKREGSVISVVTFDTATRMNEKTWEMLRGDLEDIGISSSVITDKRQFIVAWFQEAVKAGKLDEDTSSADDGTSIASGRANDSIDEALRSNGNIGSNEYRGRADSASEITEASALELGTLADMPTSRHATLPSSESEVKREQAPNMVKQKASNKGKSRLRVSTLINKWLLRDSRLSFAISLQQLQKVSDLLAKGADSNAITCVNGVEMTILEQAATWSNTQTVELLLDYGANIENSNSGYQSALFCAVRRGDETMVRLLIQRAADIYLKDKWGRTAIHHVVDLNVTFQSVFWMRELLLNDGSMDDRPTDRWVSKANIKVARLLLEHRATVDPKDMYGDSPLLIAASNGQTALVQLLLEFGADINCIGERGSTALARAVSQWRPKTMRLLIENGATVRSEFMFQAAQSNTEDALEIVHLLLENGADINYQDRYEFTALCMAADEKKDTLLRFLLDSEANTEIKNVWGQTPLIVAVLRGKETFVRLLLDKGANIGAQNVDGATPLEVAAQKKSRAVMHTLLKHMAQGQAGRGIERHALSEREVLSVQKWIRNNRKLDIPSRVEMYHLLQDAENTYQG